MTLASGRFKAPRQSKQRVGSSRASLFGWWLLRRLRGGRFEPWRAGFSIALGLFIGVQPLYGLHFLLCIAICVPLRLDALVAYAAANISNPLLAPVIVFAELQLGSLLVDGVWFPIALSQLKTMHLGHVALELGVGSALLGIVLATVGGIGAALLVRWAKERRAPAAAVRRQRFEAAVARTVARYRAAGRADRHYVANKLRFDPIGRVIDAATDTLGDVYDVGCGRGQLGLLLFELGKVRTLTGFDWDERKVLLARDAAAGVGRYDQQDMKLAVIGESDTILVADVLHYLDFEEQDSLLARAAGALRMGGRLIVRDVDARRTLASALTRTFERIGVRFAVNHGRALAFRSCAEHGEAIERTGLVIVEVLTTPGLFLDNFLLIATRAVPNGARE